jgi:hypothetical protein
MIYMFPCKECKEKKSMQCQKGGGDWEQKIIPIIPKITGIDELAYCFPPLPKTPYVNSNE